MIDDEGARSYTRGGHRDFGRSRKLVVKVLRVQRVKNEMEPRAPSEGGEKP